MSVLKSELHLRQARLLADPEDAIAEYLKAIDQAVREIRSARPRIRSLRRR